MFCERDERGEGAEGGGGSNYCVAAKVEEMITRSEKSPIELTYTHFWTAVRLSTPPTVDRWKLVSTHLEKDLRSSRIIFRKNYFRLYIYIYNERKKTGKINIFFFYELF